MSGPTIDVEGFREFERAAHDRVADGGYTEFFAPITAGAIDTLLDAAGVTAKRRVLDLMALSPPRPETGPVPSSAAGARIAQVPVSHAPRQGGRSKVSGTLSGSVRAGYAFVTTALRAAREAS